MFQRLAVDLNDYDLFMDIHHAANRLKEKRQTVPNTGKNDAGIDGLNDLAQAALIKVRFHPAKQFSFGYQMYLLRQEISLR